MRSERATMTSILDEYLEEMVRPDERFAAHGASCDRHGPALLRSAALAALGAASFAALVFATLGLIVRW
jgi:hypothetical protein